MDRRVFQTSVAVALLLALLFTGVPAVGAAENANPLVTAITIEGNKHVDESAIRAAITHTVVGKRVSREDLTKDLQAIGELGFFADASVNAEPAKDGVKMVFRVVEYPTVKQVIIKNAVLPTEELKTAMKTSEGKILNMNELSEDVRTIADKAREDYRIPVRLADHSITDDGVVTLVLKEYVIQDIKFSGNTKTKDYVLRRELKIKPGDVLDLNKVNESHRRLVLTGFFDEVTGDFTETDDPGKVILTFNVTERKTGMFTAGVGYSTQEKFLGYAEIGEDNFLGRGEKVRLRAEFGKGRTLYDLGFYEPWLDSAGTSLDLNLYRSSKEDKTTVDDKTVEFIDRRLGGNIALGRPIGDYTRASVRLKIEDNEIVEKEPGSLAGRAGTNSVRSLTLSTYTDTTNHPFYPTEGFRSRFSAEFAGRFLGGDTNFNRYTGEFSKYLKVGRNDQTLAFRVSSGLVTGENIPLQEKFRIGGAETVRGYQRGEEGFEGDKMLVLNAEYRFKIAKSVRGVVFTDAGRAWMKDESLKLSELKVGYGVGVQLDTPIGIMRLDYGIGENGGRTYFSLGQSF